MQTLRGLYFLGGAKVTSSFPSLPADLQPSRGGVTIVLSLQIGRICVLPKFLITMRSLEILTPFRWFHYFLWDSFLDDKVFWHKILQALFYLNEHVNDDLGVLLLDHPKHFIQQFVSHLHPKMASRSWKPWSVSRLVARRGASDWMNDPYTHNCWALIVSWEVWEAYWIIFGCTWFTYGAGGISGWWFSIVLATVVAMHWAT